MSPVAVGVATVVGAFLIGAIPWGYLIGKWFGGVDLRNVGSGGTGATNALRAVGRKAALAVLILDMVKGFLPVFLAMRWGAGEWWVAAAAVAAVLGHCFSPFIGFKGGKGVATGAGAAIALSPWFLLALPVVVLVVAVTRYVSLGSILGTFAASTIGIVLAMRGMAPWSVPVAVMAMSAIIIYQHRSNIGRLRAGTERKFGQKLAPTS